VQVYNNSAVSHLHISTSKFLSFAVAASCNLIVLFIQNFFAEIILVKIQNIAASGDFAPDQGRSLWTPLGASPPNPHIGSISRSPCMMLSPTSKSWQRHYDGCYSAKGGGTLCAGSAAALLVFGPVMPKGELALLVLGVCENFSSGKVCKNTSE
jgi:hypothetical protein